MLLNQPDVVCKHQLVASLYFSNKISVNENWNSNSKNIYTVSNQIICFCVDVI